MNEQDCVLKYVSQNKYGETLYSIPSDNEHLMLNLAIEFSDGRVINSFGINISHVNGTIAKICVNDGVLSTKLSNIKSIKVINDNS